MAPGPALLVAFGPLGPLAEFAVDRARHHLAVLGLLRRTGALLPAMDRLDLSGILSQLASQNTPITCALCTMLYFFSQIRAARGHAPSMTTRDSVQK